MADKATTTRRSAASQDLPYAMKLADGRTLAVEVPGRWVVTDRGGEICFTPEGVRFLDRLRALFMPLDRAPTPGFLRTLREALGMSRAEFAARLGVDQTTVTRWERGDVQPPLKVVRAIRSLRNQSVRHGVALAG
jgi:DNA-binding XRE family transcriptional regulator